MITPEGLSGLKAVVVGAAREGITLTRYLASCGAQVTLADAKPRQALAERLSRLRGADVRLALGETMPDLSGADVLFLSPGVSPSAGVVCRAREMGLPISSEPRVFTQSCAAPIVGITGSSGKTTITALVGKMYAAAGKTTWVGGNIGVPLIERLLRAERPEVAVMELSSFQLEFFSPDYQGAQVEERRSDASRVISLEGWSPHIAAVTNITPNHLDRHPSIAAYSKAKSHILEFQESSDWAVLNLDNALTRRMTSMVRGRELCFSLERPVEEGAFLQDDRLLTRFDGRERLLCRTLEVKLRGSHNLANVLTAACCAMAGGVMLGAISDVATSFAGVPHRLEVVRKWRDVVFVNDSIATSPERAMAALRSFTEPLVLLAGGRDKHLPWVEWAGLAKDVRVVVAFGEAAPIVERALQEARGGMDERGRDRAGLHLVDSLEQAVALAASLARPGDVVLLSPGGTSFDAFEDFEARGQRFRELVAGLS